MARKTTPTRTDLVGESLPVPPHAIKVTPVAAPTSVVVEVVKSNEVWSVYELEDGTVVKVKPVIAEFIRVIGQYTDEGEPIYQMKGGLVPVVRVPPKLYRKP